MVEVTLKVKYKTEFMYSRYKITIISAMNAPIEMIFFLNMSPYHAAD